MASSNNENQFFLESVEGERERKIATALLSTHGLTWLPDVQQTLNNLDDASTAAEETLQYIDDIISTTNDRAIGVLLGQSNKAS